MNIDLTSEVFYPPLKGLDPLPTEVVQRLEARNLEETGMVDLTAPEAEFRVWTKDEQGRDVVGPWIRPGAPFSRTEH